ncbi:MAG: STAS domain-containing protein [Phycisphaerae bacterium]|nr:STAS domain-containing protein [Phycisphaerae bacterium]
MTDAVRSIDRKGNTVVVRAGGDIARDQSPEFHAALVELAAERPQRMIVDLSAVTFMDSSGLGTLLEIYKRMRREGGRLDLVGVVEPVQGVFEVTRMDQFFKIYATEEEALRG